MNDFKRFVAFDCATTNTGFAVFDDHELVLYGKLYFDGNTEYEKVSSAAPQVYALLNKYPCPTAIIESSFFGTNPKIATNLAMSHGALLAGCVLAGVENVGSVVPSQWQRGIGNALLTRDEKAAIMKEYPGKSATWYKTVSRNLRKDRTIRIVNDRFNISVGDNDVADAVGIGLYVLQNPGGVSW